MSTLSPEFVRFLKGLKKNNTRDWFTANKKDYEKHVKIPFEQLVEEVIAGVQKFDPSIQTNAKEAIFRIYRDVRFSKDKTPYKPYVSANISPNGRKSADLGFYLMISGDSISIGGGAYMLDKDQLRKVRNEIYYSGKEFRSIINKAAFKNMFGELKGDKNKIIPKEFKEAFEDEPLIANKQFYYMVDYKGANQITDPKLVSFILKHFKAGTVFNEFIRKAIRD